MRTKKQEYAKAFTEVCTILSYLNEDDYNKLPKEILEVFEQNRNKGYRYEMNSHVDIFSQSMLPETKAILFNIFRDYLSNPEQKQKIIKMQFNDKKIEQSKQKKLNITNYQENNTKKQSEYHLVPYQRRSIFYRIISKILKMKGKIRDTDKI